MSLYMEIVNQLDELINKSSICEVFEKNLDILKKHFYAIANARLKRIQKVNG